MRSILERLLILLTPFLAVAAAGKKTTAKKAQTSRARSTKKAPARRERSTTAKKGKPAGTRGRGSKPRGKAAASSKSATKAQVGPPTPKPPAPIGRAILLVPENGKYAESVTPTLRWLSVGGATRYEVMWSEDSGFAGSHSVTSVATGASVPADRPLRVGATYYWRVRGGNEGGWGPWSLPFSFQVLEAPPTS